MTQALQANTNPYVDALLSTVVGATIPLVLPTTSFVFGAGLGLLNFTARKITNLALKKILPQFSKENPVSSSIISFMASTSLTIAASAGFVTALDIYSINTNFFIVGVFLTCFICCCYSCLIAKSNLLNRDAFAKVFTCQNILAYAGSAALLATLCTACINNPEGCKNVMISFWENQSDD